MTAFWIAHLNDSPADFVRKNVALTVCRVEGDIVRVVTPDGSICHPAETDWDTTTISLPIDSLEAIRSEIDRRLGRRYDEALVRELRATLEHERRRVDAVLATINQQETPQP